MHHACLTVRSVYVCSFLVRNKKGEEGSSRLCAFRAPILPQGRTAWLWWENERQWREEIVASQAHAQNLFECWTWLIIFIPRCSASSATHFILAHSTVFPAVFLPTKIRKLRNGSFFFCPPSDLLFKQACFLHFQSRCNGRSFSSVTEYSNLLFVVGTFFFSFHFFFVCFLDILWSIALQTWANDRVIKLSTYLHTRFWGPSRKIS